MSRQEIAYAIRHIDVNKNGMVTRGEFVAGLALPSRIVLPEQVPATNNVPVRQTNKVPATTLPQIPVKSPSVRSNISSLSQQSSQQINSKNNPSPAKPALTKPQVPVLSTPQTPTVPFSDSEFYEVVRKLRAVMME